MAPERHSRPNKHHQWSLHRIFLLFVLTITMILGFVVVGGGSAMMTACEKTETRRSVYLSDVVTKCTTKRELLHQLMTAWQCDIPADRIPPAIVSVSGDLPRPCDSDLLTQLMRGGQGTLAAGVLLVVASGGGYGGAISARSGPLALYIVVTVVTAVLELAAVGLLVYNKSQLDSLPGQLEVLMAQPLTEVDVEVVVLESPDGILTAAGEVPTPAVPARPGGRRSGEAEGRSSDGGDPTEAAEGLNATGTGGTDGTFGGTTESETTSGARGTAASVDHANTLADLPQGTDGTQQKVTATSSAPPAQSQTSPPTVSSSAPVTASPPAADTAENRQATSKTTSHPKAGVSTRSSAPLKVSLPPTQPLTSPLPSTAVNLTSLSGPDISFEDFKAAEPGQVSRRQRHSGEDWERSEEDFEESDEDWEDRSEEVIVRWSPAATKCLLLHGEQRNHSHCFSQLEHNLQRELVQSELVLELMMAPLVCTFLACLLQLTTICAAWNIIADQQGRRRQSQAAPTHLSTPV